MKLKAFKFNSYFWVIFLPLHLIWFSTFFWTQVNSSFFISIFIFWFLLSGCGVGAGLHRLLAHKSYKTSLSITRLLSYLGAMAVQGSPALWVNIHRGYHHPYSDCEKDIHSPYHGKAWAYFVWAIKLDDKALQFRWATDLLRDPIQRILHFQYYYVVWGSWLFLAIGYPPLFASLIWAQIITLHQEFCVNLFCHSRKIGYRNFDTKDQSVNLYLFGLLFWGVGFHNNHHANPTDYNFGHKWYEIDFTKYIVKALKIK